MISTSHLHKAFRLICPQLKSFMPLSCSKIDYTAKKKSFTWRTRVTLKRMGAIAHTKLLALCAPRLPLRCTGAPYPVGRLSSHRRLIVTRFHSHILHTGTMLLVHSTDSTCRNCQRRSTQHATSTRWHCIAAFVLSLAIRHLLPQALASFAASNIL